ncbi:CPBP family intramembrane glutamic endopeptidase [Streptomyces sp. NPDC004311]|uniref:CPBP family intramembrane glutamic endopeptidase n=1 Tax=Streptomyces sp. NPDC004311 TaxID=3364698 RepID=UPI00367F7392
MEDRTQGRRRRPRTGPWAGEAGVFLAIAFTAAGLLGALQPAAGIPPEVLQLTQLGPAFAVAGVALLWPARIGDRLAGALPALPALPARRGVRAGSTRKRAARTAERTPPGAPGRAPTARRAAALLLTSFAVIALCAGGVLGTLGALPGTTSPALGHPLLLVVAAQFLGACAEEIGWRCHLQPLLRTRFGPLTASVLVGVAWGLWHVPVLTRQPAYAAGFLLGAVALSVILGLALDGMRSNRLLLAGAFHTLVNLGMLLVTDEASADATPMLVFGAACAAAALPWIAHAHARGRRASPEPETTDTITAAPAHRTR